MPDTDQMQWLAQEFSRQFGKALEGMAGQSFPVNWQPATEADQPGPDSLWWECPLSDPAGAHIRIGAAAESWSTLSRTLLESIGLDTDDASLRSTYSETLAQAVSGLASALGARLASEVAAGSSKEIPAPNLTGSKLVRFVASVPTDCALVVFFSSEIPAVLAPKAPMPPAVLSLGSMDLLLDVDLPVSVSFGRAELPLKDVVKLTTGSIVELNRSIMEPVEIIVNNCVIARGEVVVIEGNYGVRIDEIISRHERLRTLK